MKRITARRATATMLAAAAAIALVGCSDGGSGSDEKPEKLVVWTGQANEPGFGAQQEIAEKFEAATGIAVEIVPKPPAFAGDNTSLATSVGAGVPPDLYVMDRNSLPGQGAIGMLTDLGPLLQGEDADLLDNYLPGPVKTSSFNGQHYGLPLFATARGLYFNKTLLKEVGVDPAVLDPANGAPTIELITEIAEKLDHRDASGDYDRLGFVPWYSQAKHMTWNVSHGAQFFDEDTCSIPEAGDVQVQTFEYLQETAERLGYQDVQTFIATYASTPNSSPFFTGNLGMTIDGNFFIDALEKYAPDLDYGVTYIPVAEEGDPIGTYMGGWSVVIPRGVHSEHWSWELAKFFAGEEGQRIFETATQTIPTWTDLIDDPEVTGRQGLFSSMLEDYGIEFPPLPVTTPFYSAMDQAQQAVLLGESTPEEALASVAQQVNTQMQGYCPYTIG
ncbi:extracellular solute-binding protein [Homoserinibacter sp. GY 40078]|uniref:extracellular solute-binding protein n=1 Tax=Homoserinibacter sp. GY 40078 TaxID=2603275 RepID=UPI0011CAC41E|nr:extracellular solute-binding protein [Homoserinibacter sp. GY 40078]TXK16379.1 extracellular solute-binding protein [Homoserinibacter sp. GY 40078]